MANLDGQAGPAVTPACSRDLRPGARASGQRASATPRPEPGTGTRVSGLEAHPLPCGVPPGHGRRPARRRGAVRQAQARGVALRRGMARAALCLLAAAAALVSPVPLLGQEDNAPTPGQNAERIGELSERVRALEEGDGQGAWDWASAWPAAVAVVALLEVAYRVIRAARGRTRPTLGWSASDDGLKFSIRDIPGGATCLAVRVTNFGQAAAVDIVGRAGFAFSAKRTRVRINPRPHHVGSLNPGASTLVLVPLSGAERKRALDGEAMTFRLLLSYGAMGGRRYTYGMSGMRYGSLSVLVGVVGKALPERDRQVLQGAGPARPRGRARGRGQPLNAPTGRGRP